LFGAVLQFVQPGLGFGEEPHCPLMGGYKFL
jgi:hypothetical protein